MSAAPVRWRATLPSGWAPREADGVTVLAVAPGGSSGPGSVRAHLFLAHDQLPAALPLDEVAARAVGALEDIAEELDVRAAPRVADGPLERCCRVVTFAARGSDADVAQVLAFAAPRAGGPDGRRDVVQFVGTCALDDLPRHAGVFVDVVESIALSF